MDFDFDHFEKVAEGVETPGALEDIFGGVYHEVNYGGHTFGIRTLLPWEEGAAGLAVNPWSGNLKQADMWMAAVVGLALTHVDGDEEFCPRSSPDETTYARQRMQWAAKHWHFPYLERLYREYADMQKELLAKIERAENLSESEASAFVPMADILSARADFEAATAGEAQDSPTKSS